MSTFWVQLEAHRQWKQYSCSSSRTVNVTHGTCPLNASIPQKKEAFTKDNNAAHHFFRSYEAQHDIWLSTTAGKRLTHQQLLDRAGTLHSNSRTESRQLTSSQITCLKYQKLERHSGSHRRHATAAESLVARMLTQAAVSQKATNTLLLETSRNLKGKQKHIQNWTIVQYIWIKQVCLLQYEKERRRRRHYLLI